ncbi:MAG: IS3 family transposase [Alistipes sp.]|nr:IS3 family transposase [Alistipes sp.]
MSQNGECSAKKSESLSRGERSPLTRDWAEAIKELRQSSFDLQKLLQVKGMAHSTYYYHTSKQREDKYADIRQRISEIFALHGKRYGYRRVYQQLRNEGYTLNHKTVQRLMQDMNLKSQIRRVKYRSYRGEVGKTAPNILNRKFEATRPNQKWATDVTEFKVADRKAYLSPIIDMFNGEIIAYTISDRPDLKMVMDMMYSAKRKIKDTNGVMLHSDQGWHYQHMRYQQTLKKYGITQSMSRKGNCLDNAVMENFFGIMKSELLYLQQFSDMEVFKRELRKYISYYNNDRIKLKLNGKSPVQYRTLYQ